MTIITLQVKEPSHNWVQAGVAWHTGQSSVSSKKVAIAMWKLQQSHLLDVAHGMKLESCI